MVPRTPARFHRLRMLGAVEAQAEAVVRVHELQRRVDPVVLRGEQRREPCVVAPVVGNLVGAYLVHERGVGRVGFGPALEADQRDDLGSARERVLLARHPPAGALQFGRRRARFRERLVEAPLRDERSRHPVMPAAQRVGPEGGETRIREALLCDRERLRRAPLSQQRVGELSRGVVGHRDRAAVVRGLRVAARRGEALLPVVAGDHRRLAQRLDLAVEIAPRALHDRLGLQVRRQRRGARAPGHAPGQRRIRALRAPPDALAVRYVVRIAVFPGEACRDVRADQWVELGRGEQAFAMRDALLRTAERELGVHELEHQARPLRTSLSRPSASSSSARISAA